MTSTTIPPIPSTPAVAVAALRLAIVGPHFGGRAVYLPIALSGGIPHCFVSLRSAIAAGATKFRKCPIAGTYSARWPEHLF